MAHFSCIVQDDSPAHHRSDELEQRLRRHHGVHYPGEQVSVNWVPVASGYLFTAGEPSSSSLISCTLAHHTTRDQRETYMRGVCDLWSDVTGCTDHEILVSITESVPIRQE